MKIWKIGAVLFSVAVLALVAAACVGGNGGSVPTPKPTPHAVTPSPEPTPPTGEVVVDIAAVPVLKFDKDKITVPAGTKVTVRFDNRDTSIPHNFAVYKDKTAREKIAVGEICTAPCKNSVTFTVSAPGNYFFRCDVHPTMTGTLVVK